MTRVDFYQVRGALASAIAFAGELALRADRDVLLYSTDAATIATLYALLAPRASAAAGVQPALTVCADGNPGAHHGLLINLDVVAPPWFSRFQRLAEIVHDEPDVRAGKRERYRFYRDRGYPLYHHDLSARDRSGAIAATARRPPNPAHCQP